MNYKYMSYSAYCSKRIVMSERSIGVMGKSNNVSKYHS